ncbi:unnamed protein product [Hyaloperonospora brassicae]|uniref:Zinc finger C2H2 LYAR-type domain-containing protein n=1 Tax=Hyaloperonospora brassicae TaxID=162125 RepID=A0AAV0UGC0_HYABA|nr:unnamed protein product [Hyaloperonospora brassicae]
MVFFVCEGCNETVKKNRVDSHASRCRNCWAVSCVDCSVVFEGNDYAAHTSCMSEAEKYEKSLFTGEKHKQKRSTKQTPQERWVEIVQSTTCPDDRSVQNVLTRLAGADNVPRKKNKFINFVMNSLALRDSSTLVEKVWTMYETAFLASAAGQNESSASDPVVQDDGCKKRLAEVAAQDDTVVKKAKTVNKPIKWSKLVTCALKSANKELELGTLSDEVLRQIRDKKLSTKSDKELKKELRAVIKESDKVALVQVVRLKHCV